MVGFFVFVGFFALVGFFAFALEGFFAFVGFFALVGCGAGMRTGVLPKPFLPFRALRLLLLACYR